MSRNAQAILEQFETLAPEEQKALYQELERRLWDAANSLRGPVDPADFKTYVFPMLFWKWISDTWDWEHAQALAVVRPAGTKAVDVCGIGHHQ